MLSNLWLRQFLSEFVNLSDDGRVPHLAADLRRRLATGWMGQVNYTWSRFEGNFDLDYATVAVLHLEGAPGESPGLEAAGRRLLPVRH